MFVKVYAIQVWNRPIRCISTVLVSYFFLQSVAHSLTWPPFLLSSKVAVSPGNIKQLLRQPALRYCNCRYITNYTTVLPLIICGRLQEYNKLFFSSQVAYSLTWPLFFCLPRLRFPVRRWNISCFASLSWCILYTWYVLPCDPVIQDVHSEGVPYVVIP